RSETIQAAAAAQRAADAKNSLVRDIDRRRDLNAQLAGELQNAQQKLQATLRGMNAAPAAAAPVATALPVKAFRGDLDWPLSGAVRRTFDPAATRRSGTANGIEIG